MLTQPPGEALGTGAVKRAFVRRRRARASVLARGRLARICDSSGRMDEN